MADIINKKPVLIGPDGSGFVAGLSGIFTPPKRRL
jgi:hypothetical protein